MNTAERPTPEQIKEARMRAGHTQEQAASMVYLSGKYRWSEYERGACKMDPARWALYLLLTGQHPTLIVTPRSA
jgi:DNA-binding XRE family transcriptional regulator